MLHTWGSALTHHPHVHFIVPGGGLSPDGSRWIACKPGFFLPVRVLSRLFRRLFLEGLAALHAAGRLAFFGDLAPLADKRAFDAALAPLRRAEWVVYAKRPFAGPDAVLAYLARYTHRVAISNSRLIALDEAGVTFRWKDYRVKGRDRLKTMTLDAAEFIRRFLLHVLPSGFHRIRHYGLFAGAVRARNIERVRNRSPRRRPHAEAAPPTPRPTAEAWPSPRSLPLLRRPDDHRRNLRRRAPRRPPSPPGSGSTPHDRRRAPRLATPIAFASDRAPEQERDVPTTSADSLQPPRPRPPLASSPAEQAVVFAPTINNGRPPPPPPHRRSVRDPKSP